MAATKIPAIVECRRIESARLSTRVLFSGPEGGTPVVFVHGNLSAANWWEEVMVRLPDGFRAIAPDLRSYGQADPNSIVDATRGLQDFSDDLAALMDSLAIDAAHFVGHSLGGGVLWQFLADYGDRVRSFVQVCPNSPFGFGGSKGDGSPCFADGAGTGGGSVNPEFAALLANKARGAETPFHPRNILNTFVWKPPFVPDRIEDLLTSALAQHTGDKSYPGDSVLSANWPGFAAGKFGSINALAPIYQSDPLRFTRGVTPPILWILGTDDAVISNSSMFDVGTLGQLGAIPGWPGMEDFPPQPMISQIEDCLQEYRNAGGRVERVEIPDCGHSPFLEKPAAFDKALHDFIR